MLVMFRGANIYQYWSVTASFRRPEFLGSSSEFDMTIVQEIFSLDKCFCHVCWGFLTFLKPVYSGFVIENHRSLVLWSWSADFVLMF